MHLSSAVKADRTEAFGVLQNCCFREHMRISPVRKTIWSGLSMPPAPDHVYSCANTVS